MSNAFLKLSRMINLVFGCVSSPEDDTPSNGQVATPRKSRKLTKRPPSPLHPSQPFAHLLYNDPYTQPPRRAHKRSDIKRDTIVHSTLDKSRFVREYKGSYVDKPLPETPPPSYSSKPNPPELTIDRSFGGRVREPAIVATPKPLWIQRPVDPSYYRDTPRQVVQVSTLPAGYSAPRRPRARDYPTTTLPIGPGNSAHHSSRHRVPDRAHSHGLARKNYGVVAPSGVNTAEASLQPRVPLPYRPKNQHTIRRMPIGTSSSSSSSESDDLSTSASHFTASTAATSFESSAFDSKIPVRQNAAQIRRGITPRHHPKPLILSQRSVTSTRLPRVPNPSLEDVNKSTDELRWILENARTIISPVNSVYSAKMKEVSTAVAGAPKFGLHRQSHTAEVGARYSVHAKELSAALEEEEGKVLNLANGKEVWSHLN